MQRRDSLGSTSIIPRLSKGSTRKFKSRCSQASFSSASDVFADNESTKGQADLSVNGMKLRSEKNLDGSQGRSAEVVPVSEALVDPSTKGKKRSSDPTLSQVRTSNGKKSKGRKRPRSVPRSKREKKRCSEQCPNRRLRLISEEKNNHLWSSKAKNAMMSSISPSEERTGSKAKKSWKSLYDERMASLRTESLSSNYDYPEITHRGVDVTPCSRNDMSRKALSASPTRPMSDGITMGASSTFDRLMMSMGEQKGGASSSTRLQPQLTSSSLGLTPAMGAAGDISDMFAGVMTGLEELRRDMTKRTDRVEERAHQGQEKFRDELTHVKSQARVDKAQLIRNTD